MTYSVIIPLYNKVLYIKDTILSVLNQSYENFEIIVVDDSSTDGSFTVVKSFNDNRIKLFSKPNGGVSAARNYGISKAMGDIVCFLDADDLWHPTYLSELDISVRKYPTVSFFCGAYIRFKESSSNIIGITDLSRINNSKIFVADYVELSIQFFGSVALTSTVAIRRCVLDLMDNWFDETICIGEDNDMWLRACFHTKILYNNTPLIFYRTFTEGGLTQSHYKFDNAVNYRKWYSYSKNRNVDIFATQMAYIRARKFYESRSYRDSIKSLRQIKGFHLLSKRIVLMLCCFIKSF